MRDFLRKVCLLGSADFIKPQMFCSSCHNYFSLEKVVTEPRRIAVCLGRKQLWTTSVRSRSTLLVPCSGRLTWGCIPGLCLPSSGSYSCIWESAGDKDTEAENKLFAVLTLSRLNLKLLSLFCKWFKTWGDEKLYGHRSQAVKPLSLLYWDPSTTPISLIFLKYMHIYVCI